MANLSGFDATKVEPSNPFDPLPSGTYEAVISASEMKPTKDGSGKYLKLEFTVVEGEFTNRKVWCNLNLDNPSKQAVDIAKAQLSAICRAVGVMVPQDSEELHNIPLLIVVKCREYQGNIQNDVKGFKSIGSGEAEKSAPVPSRAQATAGSGAGTNGGRAPWKR